MSICNLGRRTSWLIEAKALFFNFSVDWLGSRSVSNACLSGLVSWLRAKHARRENDLGVVDARSSRRAARKAETGLGFSGSLLEASEVADRVMFLLTWTRDVVTKYTSCCTREIRPFSFCGNLAQVRSQSAMLNDPNLIAL